MVESCIRFVEPLSLRIARKGISYSAEHAAIVVTIDCRASALAL